MFACSVTVLPPRTPGYSSPLLLVQVAKMGVALGVGCSDGNALDKVSDHQLDRYFLFDACSYQHHSFGGFYRNNHLSGFSVRIQVNSITSSIGICPDND